MPAQALPDLGDLLGRIERGAVATGPELRDVKRLLSVASVLRAFATAQAEARPALAAALATDEKLDRLAAEIDHAIDEDGTVLDRATPELARARKKAADARRELVSRLGELMNRYGDVLRDRFYTERDGRYVLPVRSDAPFKIDGIVLGSSASGGTLYVEPREVTDLGNRRQVADAEVEREIARVLGALTISVRSDLPALGAALSACVHADVLSSLARFGSASEARVFFPTRDAEMDLRLVRHPLLLGGSAPVVGNDVRLSKGRCLVVSGPNAGGKTVALKCLGLAAWMARAGIPVPAEEGSRVGWFEPVLTDIGDEQSLERSLSTFSAHAARLSSHLARAREGALILLDEVAAGTDPEEGAALASAVLEALVTSGAAVAVTTHYERLKQLAVRDTRFENASVGFDFATMSPTFRLTLGIPGASSALAVASRYGIPEAVTERARALIPEETHRRERLLREIETDRAKAEEERRAAEEDRREQAELRAALESELSRARELERARLAREGAELSALVRDTRARLRAAGEKLRAGELSHDAMRALAKDVNAAAKEVALGGRIDLALHGAARKRGDEKPEEPFVPAPGTVVFVPKLRTHAEVLEAPVRGQLKVAAGPLKLTVRLDEIAAGKPGAKAASTPKPRRGPAPPPVRTDATPVRTDSITCDVRGLRVDEAVDRVEAFIDNLLAEGEPAGFILHGHGTGALKSALREHLTGHRFVGRARAADDDQGGDAFTVLWIAD